MDLLKRNNVLHINPVTEGIGIHITEQGSDWLWAAFAIFTVFFLTHGFLYASPTFKHDVVKKNLLLVPFFTNLVLAIAYYTYAANLGYASQEAEFKHVTTGDGNFVRQIFYTKYIGWFVAWPAAMMAISIATSTLSETLTNEAHQNFAGVVSAFSSFVVKVGAAWVFVLGLLIGSLIHSSYKWGYFVFSAVAQLFGIFLVLKNLAASARASQYSKIAAVFIVFQVVVWLLYPICWALSEGGNVVQPDSEAVFYGILDLCTFSFVPTVLTWINISIMDDEFFQKLIPFSHGHLAEKLAHSPRHSGDTAVPLLEPLSSGQEQV
ncbi:CIC11C00000004686 [Sungouiella intermedia]|uniref:CIC11C00000001970 n=1 Tax=Sungouiella intermedia TaxID=45354 RepID=A0A1L0BHF7_9ASCO|nr:CIC11C00000004686 [[Candida] intermedia]SGZ49690.1 CIC11C00000001970 [[Candida] intermedia]